MELLGGISLLSPEYLLSVERWPFHSEPPDHLVLVFVPCSTCQSLQSSTLLPMHYRHDFRPYLAYLRTPPVTLWEATAPIKLPTIHCPQPGSRAKVRTSNTPGWYFNVGSRETSDLTSKPPTYPHRSVQSQCKATVKVHGVFPSFRGRLHHHKHFNFAESLEETVWPSLRHSCRSELTRQGISLP